jgi:glutamate-1-semialdehyde 2,1-aminomutase
MGLYLSREAFEAPRNFGEAKVPCDNGLYGAFFHAMLERGVAFAPGAYEILFVSLAHSDEDLARTVEAAASAAKEVASS